MPGMDVAGVWYTSGTFWTGAGTVTAVLGAVAVVWVTFTVGFPRRRLYYGMPAAARLLTAPAGMRSDLELRHHGTLLADPRVLTIELVSRGRKDIPSDAFNDRQPLQLDVGAPIVEVLQVTSKPDALLKIGPGLIGKRHEITITVLTDGEEPSLTCQSPLIDVQVRQRIDDGSPTPQVAAAWAGATAVVAVAVAVAAWPAAASSAAAGAVAAGAVVAALAAGAVASAALAISGGKRKTSTPTTKR